MKDSLVVTAIKVIVIKLYPNKDMNWQALN